MKHTLLAALALCALTQPAAAEKVQLFCDALLKEESYEPNLEYMKFLTVDENTGWISRSSDLRTDTFEDTTVAVLAEINRILIERYDATLVMVNAPQRGISVPFVEEEKKEELRTTYRNILRQLDDAGIIVPSADAILQSKTLVENKFYFPRDTHWTPEGARVVADAVADVLETRGKIEIPEGEPRYEFSDPESANVKGLFFKSINQICGFEPPEYEIVSPNVVPVVRSPEDLENKLFGDAHSTDELDIVLLGTSFGFSGGGDRFRWAAQLQYTLQNVVENLSLNGGMAHTAFESYAHSRLKDDPADIIIWEFPARYVSKWLEYDLRQVLGAVAGECTNRETQHAVSFGSGEQAEVYFDPPIPLKKIVSVTLPGFTIGQVDLLWMDSTGKKRPLRMRRRDQFPAEARTPDWRTGTFGMEGTLFGLRVHDLETPTEATLALCD